MKNCKKCCFHNKKWYFCAKHWNYKEKSKQSNRRYRKENPEQHALSNRNRQRKRILKEANEKWLKNKTPHRKQSLKHP